MSRSYRKLHGGCIFHSITCSGFNRGIKRDKTENNRRLRRKASCLLKTTSDPEEVILPCKLEEVMERWSYEDDGRTKTDLDFILSYERPWEYLRK